ncbi:MAG: 3-phosphoshikimate 1-carboxyvinyltransferase [Bacteroidales bacterium]
MEITVHPSGLKGKVEAPPSKSLTQRAIAAGVLSRGETVIQNPSFCNDSLTAMKMATALGASVTRDHHQITILNGHAVPTHAILNCGESGLALRMFAPIAALLSDRVTLNGDGSLLRRPVKMISEALAQFGVTVEANNGLLPVTLTGRMRGGRAVIDGSSGSQLLTGLLMALPLAGEDSEIVVTGLRSKPYITLTIKLLEDFGITVKNSDFSHFSVRGNQSYNAREYNIEGDWSGAAFLLVAGALAGEVSVRNLNSGSMQADRAIMQVLRDTGCHLTENAEEVKASSSELRAFIFDATDSPDLFPPLAALASRCSGTSRIRGVSRLKGKESDRAEAIADVLGLTGISVHFDDDEMLITGGNIKGAVVSSHNDHRIAMMAAVMGTMATGAVTITGAGAVDKSFPGFFDTIALLGGRIS